MERLAGDFQGAAIVNYADVECPHTRIVEHKHFAQQKCQRTVITREYPQVYEPGGEAFYPIGDARNVARLERYRSLASSEAQAWCSAGDLEVINTSTCTRSSPKHCTRPIERFR